jgi:formamidopyrimidine-DNA glycosylase
MPELPEVETVRRGLAPHLLGRHLLGARVREARLRWPVPADLDDRLNGRRITALARRGKYLVFRLDRGSLIVHLGMSGSLRLLPAPRAPGKHEHVDLLLEGGQLLRYRDPRRFGAILWTETPSRHRLIAGLGVEPLEDSFDGDWLYAASRGRQVALKTWLMNAQVIVGVGNIYANESLFHAGIHPLASTGRLSRPRCRRLATAIRETLERAIEAGGSSLRDFVDGHGEPGYFQQTYEVYGRAGQPCRRCGTPIQLVRQAGRATYYCPKCQNR